MPYRLYIKDSGTPIGTLTEAQVQTLMDLLEEEDDHDRDYYIDKDMLDYMRGEGADPELVRMIEAHVTDDEGVDIEWREES